MGECTAVTLEGGGGLAGWLAAYIVRLTQKLAVVQKTHSNQVT